jgi:hypothetical protein
MRVYITADMEGVTGLVDADDVQPGGRDYERGRAAMTADVNAAVTGALAGGATEVLVNDAHGPMRTSSSTSSTRGRGWCGAGRSRWAWPRASTAATQR